MPDSLGTIGETIGAAATAGVGAAGAAGVGAGAEGVLDEAAPPVAVAAGVLPLDAAAAAAGFSATRDSGSAPRLPRAL
jgi:hypothetical protein